MKANGITTILQFGDAFDRRRYINYETLRLSREYLFDKLVEYDFKMYIWLGNHDIAYKDRLTTNSPELLLGEYENIRVTTKPENWRVGDASVLVIPWICEQNEIACLEAIDQSKAKFCFGHFEMQGFEMQKGIICEHGTAKELFWKFDHVYSGHFHHISSKDNVTYLGTPYGLTWSDYGDKRGFFVWDTKTFDTEFIENPYQNFHKLQYDDKDNSFTEEQLDELDFTKYKDTFVKVIVSNKSNLYLYDKFIEKLESSGAIAHAVDDHQNKHIIIVDDKETEVEDIGEFFKAVADRYNEQVDINSLQRYLVTLHNEALNMVTI